MLFRSQMKDGSYTGLRPDQLTSAMGSGKESVITPREIAAFETRIKEFDEVFLTQMPVDALGATAKAESELEAARELIGPNQKPRPPGEGERKALRRQVEDAIVRAELVFSELGRSAGVLKMTRDKREVARCIKELHASMTELKKLVVLYAG